MKELEVYHRLRAQTQFAAVHLTSAGCHACSRIHQYEAQYRPCSRPVACSLLDCMRVTVWLGRTVASGSRSIATPSVSASRNCPADVTSAAPKSTDPSASRSMRQNWNQLLALETCHLRLAACSFPCGRPFRWDELGERSWFMNAVHVC